MTPLNPAKREALPYPSAYFRLSMLVCDFFRDVRLCLFEAAWTKS